MVSQRRVESRRIRRHRRLSEAIQQSQGTVPPAALLAHVDEAIVVEDVRFHQGLPQLSDKQMRAT